MCVGLGAERLTRSSGTRIGTLSGTQILGVNATAFTMVVNLGATEFRLGNGALDWGPLKSRERHPMVAEERTTTSTVRRVGLDGREPVEATGPNTTEAA